MGNPSFLIDSFLYSEVAFQSYTQLISEHNLAAMD